MLYYRKIDNKIETTVSNYELDGWISYEEGKEPQELLEFLNSQLITHETTMKVIEAKQYLINTDFYYARLQETGEEVPAEIKAKRQEAREFIRANEGYK